MGGGGGLSFPISACDTDSIHKNLLLVCSMTIHCIYIAQDITLIMKDGSV